MAKACGHDLRTEQRGFCREVIKHALEVSGREADAAAYGDTVETKDRSQIGNKPRHGCCGSLDDWFVPAIRKYGPRVWQAGGGRDGAASGNAFDGAHPARAATGFAKL